MRNLLRRLETFSKFKQETESIKILRDGRSIVVNALGSRFSGSSSHQYRYNDKYLIPVDFKATIPYDECEICLMTRAGLSGPEYHFSVKPIPPDNPFDWSPDLKLSWDRVLQHLISLGKDVTAFKNSDSPLIIFGITDETVQAPLLKQDPSRDISTIEGVLHCKSGETPSLEEYERYLGLVPEFDADFFWIAVEFRDELLPPNWYQYVSEKMAYWVSSTNETEPTWKHPLFDKYRAMLLQARTQRPSNSVKSIMAFQITFFFSQSVESEISRILEFARIFRIDLKKETFLVHVIRRALNHYSAVVSEKREISGLEDFQTWIDRYRKSVSLLEKSNETDVAQVSNSLKCVECKKNGAKISCDFCQDLFCQDCFAIIHKTGRRKLHTKTIVELTLCSECDESIARFQCRDCQDAFCEHCFQNLHRRGGRRNHLPSLLCLPLIRQKLLNFRHLEKVKSPWVKLKDKNAMNFFYNFQVGESCRDLPLAQLNEIIDY